MTFQKTALALAIILSSLLGSVNSKADVPDNVVRSYVAQIMPLLLLDTAIRNQQAMRMIPASLEISPSIMDAYYAAKFKVPESSDCRFVKFNAQDNQKMTMEKDFGVYAARTDESPSNISPTQETRYKLVLKDPTTNINYKLHVTGSCATNPEFKNLPSL